MKQAIKPSLHYIAFSKQPMSNQTNNNDAKSLPSGSKEAAVLSEQSTTKTKTFEDRLIEKICAVDAHDSTVVATSTTEQVSVLPFRSRIIQNLPDGSQKITTTTTITHPDGRKEVTTHEVIVPSGTNIPEDDISNKVVCLEQVDDAVEPIPLVQRLEMINEDEVKVKEKHEQLERSRIHHNHHHNHHHKRRKKRSAVQRAPDVGPSFEEDQPHEPHRSACSTTDTSATTDNDRSNTTSTASNPSRAIQIHDEEAAPTTSSPCSTDEDALGTVFIPEATLVDDNPREYKFLMKNIAIVASTLLVVVVLVVVLFVTTEKKDPKEQDTTGTIGDQKPPTGSKPESYFSPGPEERFFVCEDINDEMEGCLDADCVGDSSKCKCKAFHRVKATKEITGHCDSCTVCDDLITMMGFECSNLAKGYPEEMREEAHPNGPLGSKQCASAETNTPPSRAPFGWDKPLFLCFTRPSDPTQENCVEATCLTNSTACSCQMYTRWAVSKNIISYCESCEVCGPQVPLPLAGDCGMSPADMGGVERSCDDYPLINATAESELLEIDGSV